MIIEVKNLTKKFGNLVAVNGISFEVEKGMIFAFLGPNGAGKSTTIKMLTTILKPTSGKMLIDGIDVVEDSHEARKSFGIVFQDQSLDEELTAFENMEFHGVLYGVPKKLRRERMEQLLKMVELWDRRNDQVKKFSGGMRRRLEIARGLLHHPKVLFLDEPTLGLDPQTRSHIWNYVKKLNEEEGITIFFSTHYMDEVEKLSDKIVIIDHGNIILEGTAEEIKEKTQKDSLEEAFIELTGKTIREEAVSREDNFKMHFRSRH